MKSFFHKVSYLAYPLYAIGAYFYVLFMKSVIEQAFDWNQLNLVLLFLGIGVSLSTLQDTRTTQNNLSKKIWEHPVKGKAALIIMGIMILFLLGFGLWGVLRSTEGIHKDVSLGIIVLGIGYTGLLKAAIEMRENHVIRD